MKLLDVEKLETVLRNSWNQFINIRELRDILKTIIIEKLDFPDYQVQKFSISRFELVEDGFITWIETTIQKNESQINLTLEFFLSKKEFKFLNHI
jgi:hypothetical protein